MEKNMSNQEEVAIRFQSFVDGQRELQILVCVGGGDVCVQVCDMNAKCILAYALWL